MYINREINWLKYLKNEKVYLFGCGKQGRRYCLALEKENIDVVAFIDNNAEKIGGHIFDKKVLSLNEYVAKKDVDSIVIITTVYANEIKLQLMEQGIFKFVDVSQIDVGGGAQHYDESYFEWQCIIGKFGGMVKANIFKPHIKSDMKVVEFGCGGGFLLNNINAVEKVGIEINDTARKHAEELGIKCYKYSSELPDNYADIIISTHVLEHTENPLGELRMLYSKMKDGGKIVFHVPNESCDTEYVRSDNDNHLYTWNSLTLGNLFKTAGFFVYSVKTIKEVWPENWEKLDGTISRELFEALDKIRGEANDINNCVIVAYK